jgi:hypothetical protein
MLLLYVATLFLSSLLMFLLEPMAAKMVLPLLGGAPAVWNTCVVFFQAMLLAGYAYAHGAPARLGVKRQAAFHAVLVLLPLLTLPFAISSTAASERHPVAWLLLLLLTSIGLPFFVLTTTAPLLQKWFSKTDHPAAGDPYFLYAASNVGSLIGLVMYPGLVEPMLRLRDQSRVWALGYVVFAGLAVSCAIGLWQRSTAESHGQAAAVPDGAGERIGVARRLRWIALAFAPSSLMLAVTTFVSTDIAAVPLLWIVPLALYLLTFVLAFNSPARFPNALVDRGLPLLMLALVFLLILRVTGPMVVVLPIHLTVFFLSALLCHRALADDRPSPVHLTEFFFWVALGGILGSLFNTLAAPVLFTGIVEYPVVLVLVCLLRRVPGTEGREQKPWAFVFPVAAGALTLAVMLWGSRLQVLPLRFGLLFLAAFLCLRVSRTRLPFALGIGLMLVASMFHRGAYGTVLHAERTFFGTYRVRLDPTGQYRSLFHGTTLHGMQSVSLARRHDPLAYHHRSGPFGDLFQRVGAETRPEVGVIGLGVGALASYQKGAQRWTFYEIDPAVERIARNADNFTYMSDCGDRCQVVIGDARLSLNATSDRTFGLFVVDAFSSDAIPVHLMTREALALYLARLAPGGLMAFHISNRHLSLEPVLARLAEDLNLVALIRRQVIDRDISADGLMGSDWLVMGRDRDSLGSLAASTDWVRPVSDPEVRLWTDDFSNILSVLGK